MVRSKSEVIVADILTSVGVSYEYEQKLPSKDDPNDFRLPDFTVSYEGDTFYWSTWGCCRSHHTRKPGIESGSGTKTTDFSTV